MNTSQIYEIMKPGTWIAGEDRDAANAISRHLHLLESMFYEANLCLVLFERARMRDNERSTDEEWEAESSRRAAVQERLVAQQGMDVLASPDASLLVDMIAKRSLWAEGSLPRTLLHMEVFIYARAFLGALDMFDKLLTTLVGMEGVPDTVAELSGRMGIEFPTLRGIRNSVQHLEDRARGLDQRGKSIQLQPVATGGIHAPGGALILGNLNGITYGATLADGSFGEIDVSAESMSKLQTLFQNLLSVFSWFGPRSHLPQ